MSTTVILGIPDLIFESRVNAIARKNGIATIPTFTPHDLLSKAHGEHPSILLIDLDAEQLAPLETIARLKNDEHTTSISIVGFIPQPDVERQQAAEAAGCQLVFSRSELLLSLDKVFAGSLFH